MGHPSLSTVVWVYTTPSFAFTRAGALSFRPSGPSFGCGGDSGDLDAIHQYIHDRNVLSGNNRQNELFGAGNPPIIPPGDLRADRLGGSLDGFGGDFQSGQHLHGSQAFANAISLLTTASMRLTPGEDSRPAIPRSQSTGCCPVEQLEQ